MNRPAVVSCPRNGVTGRQGVSASAILKLQAAGFSVEQVTALAELIDSQASRKSDLLEVEHHLETRINDVEHRLETKIDDVEHRLEAKIDEVEHRLEARIIGVETKIAESKIDMIKWMVGLLLAQTGLLLGGLKLFLH